MSKGRLKRRSFEWMLARAPHWRNESELQPSARAQRWDVARRNPVHDWRRGRWPRKPPNPAARRIRLAKLHQLADALNAHAMARGEYDSEELW